MRWRCDPRQFALILFCLATFLPVSSETAENPASLKLAAQRPGWAGDAACAACHREVSESYSHTAHHLTSQIAGPRSILGSFRPGGNILTISDPSVRPSQPAFYFDMEERAGKFTETAVTGWGKDLLKKTESIDLVTGSGARGQTYLYWQGDQLFELPVSYWRDGNRWVNSPGFVDGTANFSRPVNPGCLECHATYIRPLSSEVTTNSYEKDSLVTGIACETCHGPGAGHVARYAASAARRAELPQDTILNPAKFSRDRQVDACAYCHSGLQREAVAPAFSFVPGKPLTDFFKPLPVAASEHPDVHGNQVGLLERSRCYQSSPSMSCATCHDTHTGEKAAASYSSKCLSCHLWTACGVSKKIGHSIVSNCIDCHMPAETTNVIVSETSGQVVRAKMRNHWIKVYPGG
ncbi:hypothetical protein ACPOL_5090 [Acidisarcina polymorpha]|uniref:Cytochrome c-552/4 domain-containing protein n=1 Tax=Acidisarcina polymorpha TaxID=2211140 RepID=A0A2Z5G714_9BACT|nr:multiheme c-type cytochrome [Acidisarcina polymorpha]AXC14346.1 hypothetical protein ACPOL_5090 [Acidisarcina polymorpha]